MGFSIVQMFKSQQIRLKFGFFEKRCLNTLSKSIEGMVYKTAQHPFQIRNVKIQQMQSSIINPQKSLKTFVFQREDTQQSVIVDHEIHLEQPLINLSYLFSLYCPLAQNKVSIYDPSTFRFVKLEKIGASNGYVPKDFLEPTFILVRYIADAPYTGESDSVDSSMSNQGRPETKDTRNKQRSIKQVIQLVKKWRDLHLQGHNYLKRRLNLQEAAKLVGVSKKSLDDYYCQLRLGELYHFDFYKYLDQKMGLLRGYIKYYRPERENKRRQNDKHPKNLRIIEQFDLQAKQLRPHSLQVEEKEEQPLPNPASGTRSTEFEENRIVQEPQDYPMLEMGESTPIEKELSSLENQFFKGFNMSLDNQIDPYFDLDRDFRKKDYALDSDSFLLFE